jgi:glycine dehydrogenase subunit 1
MSYVPHTSQDIQEMLQAIAITRIEDLFEGLPESHLFPHIDLPSGLSQMETGHLVEGIANLNTAASKSISFLGAGVYNHYIPAIISHILMRGEFLTAYTPYQPEISQGTLQAVFEYQSMICALTGMDVANASHYDGATALAEAVILSLNATQGQRKRIILSQGIHPEYRQVARTYTQGIELDFVGDDLPPGHITSLADTLDTDTALVAVQYPDFFGNLYDFSELAARAHEVGALVCTVVDPLALGLLKPPGQFGADIVVGEGQSLGIPMNYGGPYLGFFATREKYVRKMAGRLVGETRDTGGQTGYVLTLATREQHIRRDKATSNICTNQGLMALAACVYMSIMGKYGLRKVAELCYQKAHYAASQINQIPGYHVDLQIPFFKEFVIECPRPAAEINQYLLEKHNMFGGYNLGEVFPERANQLLAAFTELNTRAQIDSYIAALGQIQ